MAEKFIKDEKGIVLYTTTSNLQLEKPLVSDNYDINVHNRNMDKIDEAINEVKGQVDGLELTSTKVIRPNKKTVEESLSANETSILEVEKIAESAKQRGDEVKQILADKLISEGLNVSASESFESLIGKILIGKKWASGKAYTGSASTAFTYWQGTSTYPRNYIDIVLPFSPSLIIATDVSSGSSTGVFDVRKFANNEYGSVLNPVPVSGAVSSGSSYRFKIDEKVLIGKNMYRIPVAPSASSWLNTEFEWVAYE